MASRLLCVALLLCATGAAADCECLWQGSFVDVQAKTDLVISGTVIDSKGNSIDVSLDRILRGSEALETIRIWLQTGDYCRPPVAEFQAGSQWVMALDRITETVPGGFNPLTPNISYGRIGDYSLSSCGGYWLAQTENLVTGNLIDAARWDRAPKMTPVRIDLVAAFVRGDIDRSRIAQASREDPAVRKLMLDTKAFLRAEQ